MTGRMSWRRALVWVVLLIVAVVLPQVLGATNVNLLSEVIYIAVAALGLSLLTGFNGQISLGHGAFMGMGAYLTIILTVDYDVSYLAAMIVSILFTFVVGMIVGLPALRITGIYLALVTLALATLFPQVVIRLGDLTGSTVGRTLVPRDGFGDSATLQEIGRRRFLFTEGFRAPDWTGLADDQWVYYVFLVVAIVAFVIVRNLVGSRVGRGLVAIRDNETAAEVAGVHVSRYKVLTFGVSAAVASVGGWMFAVLNNGVSPTSFTIVLSITLLVAAVLGGVNSIMGPAIGALIIVVVRESVPTDAQRFTNVALGAVLILIMLVAPGGIVGVYRRTSARISANRARAAASPAASPDADAEPSPEPNT